MTDNCGGEIGEDVQTLKITGFSDVNKNELWPTHRSGVVWPGARPMKAIQFTTLR